MKNKIFTIALAMVSQFGFSQEINTEKLDAYFKALEDNQKFMGSVVIAKEGKPIYTKSVGFANIEKGTKNTENTRFRIGSITKTFTSILVLKAVEEGRLSLNDKLSKFYPNIKNAEKITIENMLQNRSGIASYTDNKEFYEQLHKPISEKEMVKKIESYESDFEPDTKYEYNNSNFILLGYIVEKVFKKSYADLVKKYITKPLGLKNTYLGKEKKENEAHSYRFSDSKWEKEKEIWDLSQANGAGAMISTTSDLIKFINEFPKLLTKEHFEKMKTFRNGYGYGLLKLPFDGNIGYGHGGTIENFHSMAAYFPNEKISYSRVINGVNLNQNDLDIGLLNILFNKEFEIPNFKTIQVEEKVLEKYVGTYFSKQIPLKIKFFIENGKLMSQATGQGAFPLEATAENKFKFDEAGIEMEFPENGKMILKQGGGTVRFTREVVENTPTFTPTEADLKTYVGTYSSKKISLKIKFFIENGKLMSQADGQEAFELEAVKQHHFRFEPAGIKLEFVPTEKKMKFTQGGMAFEFEKE